MTGTLNSVDARLFRGLSLFAGLDDKRLAKIASQFTPLDIPAEAELLQEGEDADQLYILLEGRVSLSVAIPGRAQHETVVSTLSRGQLLGWSALLPNNFWKASAHTLKPCRLLRASGKAIRDLCERDHEIGYCLMKNALVTVGQRLEDCRLQSLNIFGSEDG